LQILKTFTTKNQYNILEKKYKLKGLPKIKKPIMLKIMNIRTYFPFIIRDVEM